MAHMLTGLAMLALLAWLYLAFGRGRFCRVVSFDTVATAARGQWPDAAVIVLDWLGGLEYLFPVIGGGSLDYFGWTCFDMYRHREAGA